MLVPTLHSHRYKLRKEGGTSGKSTHENVDPLVRSSIVRTHGGQAVVRAYRLTHIRTWKRVHECTQVLRTKNGQAHVRTHVCQSVWVSTV